VTTNGPDAESNDRVPREPAPHRLGAAHSGVGHGLGRMRTLVVVAGVVAGLAAFGVGEATSELIPPDTVQFNFFGAKRETVSRDTPRVVRRTTALAYGVLGVCLGGCLGFAGDVARRSAAASVAGGLLGAVLGAVLGGQATLWLLPSLLELRQNHRDLDMIIGMLIHGVIWGPLGAAAGLAFAIGLGDSRLTGRALAAGLVGAVLGAVAFDLVGAFAFPLAKTDSPISLTWPSRLLARLLVCVATAAVVALVVSVPRPARAAVAQPPLPTPEPQP